MIITRNFQKKRSMREERQREYKKNIREEATAMRK